ncbi:MAG: phosphatidylglycerophosphatase A [Proteobacteria bacterium]|nr:phosphatidylglycerophosphatase A [Pseudomonadota bacterium]MBI3496059.1 phosphatidylglycerophosphatase A [Pseudomonadota bacterium]
MKELGFWHPATLIATWFGVGLIPLAPGTWGSLAALPFAWAIERSFGAPALLAAGVGVFLIGVWATDLFAKRSGMADPPQACVDEVAAMWLVLASLPQTLLGYALGFCAFRAADILKPWPVSLVDRQVTGGLGIMLDDAVAALYAIGAARLVLWIMK